MRKEIPIRSDRTRNGKSKTGNRIVLIRLLKRKLEYMKRISKGRQQILDEILREISYSIRVEREKENPAYTERILKQDSGIMQKISNVYVQWISSLPQRKLQKTKAEKLCVQSIRLFGQKESKTGMNRKYSGYFESIGSRQNGTESQIWISSLMVSPKNSRYSEVFT